MNEISKHSQADKQALFDSVEHLVKNLNCCSQNSIEKLQSYAKCSIEEHTEIVQIESIQDLLRSNLKHISEQNIKDAIEMLEHLKQYLKEKTKSTTSEEKCLNGLH